MSSGAPCMYVCNKDGLKNVKKEEEEKVSSENVGLLCSRSVSQPRLKVSVNVSLNDILCITESFVTKPSMVRRYKSERHMQKMGFCLQSQGQSN